MIGHLVHRPRARRNDRGTVTVLFTVMTIAIIAAAGLAFDGGRVLSAGREGDDVAAAAARNAADAAVPPGVFTGGPVAFQPGPAKAAAQATATAAGWTMSGFTISGDTVSVSVSKPVTMRILPVVGLGSRTVTGQGSATALWGVLRAERDSG